MFEAFDASSSGLYVERIRMTAIANNLANVHTTRDEWGNKVPFRRKLLLQMPGNVANLDPKLGVQVERIIEDDSDFQLVHNPAHPDALQLSDFYVVDENGESTGRRRPEYQGMPDAVFDDLVKRVGYVQMPNVNPVNEMKDAMLTARAYEANVAAIQTSKSLLTESLSLIA